eukprot:jgi/Phyca11/16654/fgenesh1_pg.PHYCAscaffold_21_\
MTTFSIYSFYPFALSTSDVTLVYEYGIPTSAVHDDSHKLLAKEVTSSKVAWEIVNNVCAYGGQEYGFMFVEASEDGLKLQYHTADDSLPYEESFKASTVGDVATKQCWYIPLDVIAQVQQKIRNGLVISPTRARASESEERPVSSAAEQQPDPASADETLAQGIATAVVRNPPEEEHRQLPSPRPQRNLDAVLSASLTPYGTSLNAPFEPRSPSPSAYETGTRSSSDKTTKNDNMGTWQASQIQLASTKFDGKVENWSRWKTEMQTIFHWQGLLKLVQGREEFDQARADRSQEWKNCFETRERKAHTEIVLSLHGDLLDRFKSDIESARPAQLWTALLRTYDGTQGTNSVYLKQDIVCLAYAEATTKTNVYKMLSTSYSSLNELLKSRKTTVTGMMDMESNAESML